MLFNSYAFLFVFLPLALLVWWLPKQTGTRLSLLILASYAFYGWWDWRFCLLMLAVTCSDYLAAGQIAKRIDSLERKSWLVGTILFNLGLLGWFKYAGFFTASVNDLTSNIGIAPLAPTLEVILPLGISFYIFESLSYTIDIYRGIAKPARSFLHYALFISIFPKLIAGPIIRYTDVEEQYFQLRPAVDVGMMWKGIVFFLVGLAKKVLIADKVAAIATPLLSIPAPTLIESWIGVGAYTMQIYFDFSGYSDMAVGLGFMLGFRFPQNFNRPYLSGNISEFWDRWHITLSRWLRDYLFIPLGGSRHGIVITLRNLVIVMFLGGLWHGANWTFVVWGLYNGLLLAGFHGWRHLRGENSRLSMPKWPARAVTLVAVMFGWALFASPNIGVAWNIIQGMLGLNGFGPLNPLSRVASHATVLDDRLLQPTAVAGLLVAMLASIVWVLFVPEVWDWKAPNLPERRHAYVAAAVAVACLGSLAGYSPFIYYQF